MTVEQLRKKKTALINLPSDMYFRCKSWTSDNASSFGHVRENYVTYGVGFYNGEEYIYVESKKYDGTNYYMVKLEDLLKLYKIQEPQFLFL